MHRESAHLSQVGIQLSSNIDLYGEEVFRAYGVGLDQETYDAWLQKKQEGATSTLRRPGQAAYWVAEAMG